MEDGCCGGQSGLVLAGPDSMRPSLRDALTQIAASGASMLYFGQTVFWDEPTKAVLLPALDALGLRVPVIAGIHDTDYFSKLPGSSGGDGSYAIVGHNDGSTRELWAAIGEISALFGSETVVEARTLRHYGVPVSRLARRHGGSAGDFIDRATEAWGWRGMVRRDNHDVVGLDIRVDDDIAQCIEAMVRWAAETTLSTLADGPTRAHAESFAAGALEAVASVLAALRGRRLTRAFQRISCRLHQALLGRRNCSLSLTASSGFYLFNRQTAGRQRFTPLDWFLSPTTHAAAVQAYNAGVEGSGAYTLDQFGDGAVPFDVVVPRRGRGTLRIAKGMVLADFPQGTAVIGSAMFLSSRERLAELIERRFGLNCMVIGKAAILPCMFLSESVMVLNEGGSAYIDSSTRKLVTSLKRAGLGFRLFPILRLHFATFDSMEALDASFRLPDHLARAFRRPEIAAAEFARTWRNVVDNQAELLDHLRDHASPVEMLEHAAEQGDPHWVERREQYERLRAAIRRRAEETKPWREELCAQRDRFRAAQRAVQELERESGRIRRELLNSGDPALAERREAVRQKLLAAHHEMREATWAWRDSRDRVAHEDQRGHMALLREQARLIEVEVETERFTQVRAALLTRALPKADHRPSAWWFLMLDREHKWFGRLATSVEARFEELAEGVLPHCWGLTGSGA